MFGTLIAGLLVVTSVLLVRSAGKRMFAGDVGRAFDDGLHIAQSAVRSRTKGAARVRAESLKDTARVPATSTIEA